jgi:D-methionine transport system substrate-binding protein
MKLKKIASTLLAAAVLILSFTACGSAAQSGNSSEHNADDTVTVKLGVVGSIYEDLWAPAKETLKDEGINLQIVQFSDYVTPNNALNNGDIDLNAFQHRIYLESEIEQNGYDIEPIGYTFIIPLNLYSSKVSSLEQIQDGDTIAIPDDVTNGGRALKVLEAAGLVKLKVDAGFSPTIDDIETYNINIKIEELKANTIPSVLSDVTAGVVNGNYALDFGLKTDEAIYQDSELEEKNYWNLIAARSDDLKDPDKAAIYKKIVSAFQSDATEKVFNDTYGGYFIKVGWDQGFLADT